MKLVLNPSYYQLRNFVQKLPISFPTLGDCIYKARNELRKFSYEGQWYVVKNYKVPLFINRIAYTFFRPSKASRAYEYALRLRSMGIETPAPVAYIELKSGGLLQHSFFVSENCSYPRMMREFEEGGIAGQADGGVENVRADADALPSVKLPAALLGLDGQLAAEDINQFQRVMPVHRDVAARDF